MKLDTKALRYLTPEDWRVLTSVRILFSSSLITPFPSDCISIPSIPIITPKIVNRHTLESSKLLSNNEHQLAPLPVYHISPYLSKLTTKN